jgi:hypothetical protein
MSLAGWYYPSKSCQSAHSKFSFQRCVCAQHTQLVLASQSFNNLVHALSLLIPTALPIFLARTALPLILAVILKNN